MSRASQRRLAKILASATAGMVRGDDECDGSYAGGNAGPDGSIADIEGADAEDGPAALDGEAVEALAAAAASYLSELEEVAAAVDPRHRLPITHHQLAIRCPPNQPTGPNMHPAAHR